MKRNKPEKTDQDLSFKSESNVDPIQMHSFIKPLM